MVPTTWRLPKPAPVPQTLRFHTQLRLAYQSAHFFEHRPKSYFTQRYMQKHRSRVLTFSLLRDFNDGRSIHRLRRRCEILLRHLCLQKALLNFVLLENPSHRLIRNLLLTRNFRSNRLIGLPFLTKLPHSNFEPRRHLHGTFRAASLAPQCHRALLPIPTAKLAEVHGGHSKAIRYLHCLQPPRLRKLYHDLPTRCNVRYEMVGDRGTTDMYHFAIPSSRHAQVWGHVERRFLPGQICIIPWTRG